MSELNPLKVLQLMIAVHEAAHVVAIREFAGVGSRVTVDQWDSEDGCAWTEALGHVSNDNHLNSLTAALVITDEIDRVLPGLLSPHQDWAELSRLTGLDAEQIRASLSWRIISAWVELFRLEIGAVAQEIMEGREIFELT